MNISNGLNIINHAQQRSENAAKEIVGLTLQKTDTGGVEYNPGSLIKPVLGFETSRTGNFRWRQSY